MRKMHPDRVRRLRRRAALLLACVLMCGWLVCAYLLGHSYFTGLGEVWDAPVLGQALAYTAAFAVGCLMMSALTAVPLVFIGLSAFIIGWFRSMLE